MSLLSILIDSLVVSIFLYGGVFLMIKINPRSQMHNYPPEITKNLPPKTPEERKILLAVGIPSFLLIIGYILLIDSVRFGGGQAMYWQALVHWIAVHLCVSAIDLFLDYWLFCTVTPKFFIIPGTEGNPGYKDKSYHTKTIPSMLLISVAMGAISSVGFFLFR